MHRFSHVATGVLRPDSHYAWRGPSLLILENGGIARQHPISGFWFRETRFLRRFALRVNGEEPTCCSLAAVEPWRLEYAYIFPEDTDGGGGGSGSGGSRRVDGVLVRSLELRLSWEVRPASLVGTLVLVNRWDESLDIDLSFELSADYLGLNEALLAKGRQRAEVRCSPVSPSGLRFQHAHERLPFETRVEVQGGGDWKAEEGQLRGQLQLLRQQPIRLEIHIRALDYEDALDEDTERRRIADQEAWIGRQTRLMAPGYPSFVDLLNRAMLDFGSMALLDGLPDEWLTPAAGYPLYPAIFGRDALTAGWQAGAFDRCRMLEHSLTLLGRQQGQKVDSWRDEWPGRIVQQIRRDPLARLGETPFDRYFGDQASPLMYCIALANIYAWTGERERVLRHWDNARRALDWARQQGDLDGDGYIEYQTLSPQGPKHQGWKDSGNAVVDDQGRQVDTPIATCEVQAYHFAALQLMAVMGFAFGHKDDARAWLQQSRELKERFNRDFWMEDEGYLAFGLGPDKLPIRSIASNAGHCLAAGILDKERVPRLVERMFQPDLYSGWGIRTLSSNNPSYHPLSYHLGSVWPVENATIVFGLRRYGLDERALQLTAALLDLAMIWKDGRLPECVGGLDRDEWAHPGAYPRANCPQAWNCSAWPLITQAMLGLQPLAPIEALALDPVLPEWLPELTVHDLQVGQARVSLRVHRDETGQTRWHVIRKEGSLRILHQPPVDDLHAGLVGRIGHLVKDLLSRS